MSVDLPAPFFPDHRRQGATVDMQIHMLQDVLFPDGHTDILHFDTVQTTGLHNFFCIIGMPLSTVQYCFSCLPDNCLPNNLPWSVYPDK